MGLGFIQMFSQVITRVVLCERPGSNPHACTHIVAEGVTWERKPSLHLPNQCPWMRLRTISNTLSHMSKNRGVNLENRYPQQRFLYYGLLRVYTNVSQTTPENLKLA